MRERPTSHDSDTRYYCHMNSESGALNQSSGCCKLLPTCTVGPILLPGHNLSVIKLSNHACKGLGCLAYCVSILKTDSFRHSAAKRLIVRQRLALRLYTRYSTALPGLDVETYKQSANNLRHKCSCRCIESPNVCCSMPGYTNPQFLHEMCSAVCRKMEDRFSPLARTVTPDLYRVWSISSNVNTELFADAFNESGVLKFFCSCDRGDSAFGAVGKWEDVEYSVQGAAGNPPFEKGFLDKMVTEFDKGARGTSPYCRYVILPLGSTYGIKQRTSALSSKAFMLVQIPPGNLPFALQDSYFSYRVNLRYHKFQELGLFVWLNREYLEKYPPPQDLEVLYLHWIYSTCINPAQVTLNVKAFSEAFPISLRKGNRSINNL